MIPEGRALIPVAGARRTTTPHSTNGLDLPPHLARALQDEGYK